ncbi:Heme-binding protein A [Calidithermus terrae]|uniref:Heme-binding protein A n=1 Tax=Calidithermus terrae TaxID=1408545 RepID=A0A399ERA4_9DEIN|nr:ABC transporter substrate-binding protein [Calidithermus terrae]RIH86498.1 Heme-binding protein A [Calidithermus terrae]
MRRFAAALGLVALLGVGLAQKSGGVLRAGMQADPVGLDPHTTSATATRNQLENVYDTLVRFDSKGKIVPSLAQRWGVSQDGLTWTFTLRPDVRFHNGRALEAADVVYSIGRIKDPAVKSPRAGDFAVVDSVTAPNRTTVVFKLKQPFAPLLAKLAFTLNVIVPKEAAATLGNKPVGTGPFVFVEYIPNTRMVLQRNPNYWERDAKGNRLPYLDGITYIYLPDATARTTALRAGSVDWIEYVPAADIQTIKNDPKLDVVGGLSANFRSLYFNLKEKPLDDVRVRQAIAYALNPQEVVDVALFGAGGIVAKGTTIPAGGFYSYDKSPYGKPNLERARQLLREAGYPNGFTLDLKVTSTYDFLRAPAEVIQAQLAKVGIKVNIQAEEWSVYLPNFIGKKFAATIIGESGQGDPDDFLYNPFHTKGGGNYMNFSDPALDKLLEEGRATADQEDRKAIYDRAQERILQLVPMVPLFHSAQYEGLATYVKGFEHFPNTSYLGLRTTWLDR